MNPLGDVTLGTLLSLCQFATAVVRTLKVFIMRFGTLLAFVEPCALHVDVLEQMGIALAIPQDRGYRLVGDVVIVVDHSVGAVPVDFCGLRF